MQHGFVEKSQTSGWFDALHGNLLRILIDNHVWLPEGTLYAYTHTCMHTSIHSSMRTHVHTHIRTYVHSIPLHWIALHCTALHYITLHLIDFRVPWGSPLEFFSPFHALGIDIFRAEDFTVKCSGSGPRSSAPNGYWNGIRGVPVFLRQAQTNKQGSCCSV
jgi:hypothetical protein